MTQTLNFHNFKSLAADVSNRLQAGESKESIRDWAYGNLELPTSPETLLWWCHALSGLWLLALTDSELFPDLEFRFGSPLEASVSFMRKQRNRKDLLIYPEDSELFEINALWFQAQLLHFFWNAPELSSDQTLEQIAQIESFGKLILSLLNGSDNEFLRELAFPPSFVTQDWSAFLENRMKKVKDLPSPPTKARRAGQKLTQILAKRWSSPNSNLRLG